ncbi:MAG: hypothetical protein QOH97_3274 [Actinoplanes sp.]|nr:hypothetical protein [Actinoplanes sp.]
MSGRGSTGRGRPAVMPGGAYAAAEETAGSDPDVEFQGEDGRRAVFSFGRLPLPGWHGPLAQALRHRIGPAGSRRTRSSAVGVWGPADRFLRFLGGLPRPPVRPADLTVEQVRSFYASRITTDPNGVVREIRQLAVLFDFPPLRATFAQDVLDFIGQRRTTAWGSASGYSDGELTRLLAAARRHAAAIRDRIDAAEQTLAALENGELAGEHREAALSLARMAQTGEVPRLHRMSEQAARLAIAEQLFLTRAEAVPFLVLLVAASARNIESIKELPVEHRVLDGQAVELRVVKRRRGKGHWEATVTWEIGPPHRELHTAGGLYLLLLRLTGRSRGFSGSRSVWSLWRHGTTLGVEGVDEHYDPFARRLDGANLRYRAWVSQHELLADPDAKRRQLPLRLSFQRLRTSVEVRRTKQMGGHLPSAARSNTMPVLFRHYLRGDPTVTAWAEEVISEAVTDAEQAALAAHERALRTAGGALRVVTGSDAGAVVEQAGIDPGTARAAAIGQLDTGWSACTDHDRHPATGQPCQVSFLDCFHCGNCLITRDHLPRLLGLLDALAQRRQQLSEDAWWARYGPAWAAIRRDVLTRFTPAELSNAEQSKPVDAILDLVENAWETP